MELFQGPLLAPIRVTGVGGAYAGLAEGPEGSDSNAASPSVRDSHSYDWFDFGLNVGAQLPGAFAKTDFDNRGERIQEPDRVGDFIALTLGGEFQFGNFGISAGANLQQFTLTPQTSDQPGLAMQIGRYRADASFGFFGNQLHLGGGIRAVQMRVAQEGSSLLPVSQPFAGRTLLSTIGLGPEVGALLMPDGSAWRLGATFRAPAFLNVVASDNATETNGGVKSAGAFVLPGQVVLPWEVEVGVAYQLGPRPLNPPWINPRTERTPLEVEVEAARAARAREAEAILATLPPGEREARRADLARSEAVDERIEDEELAAEDARRREERRARDLNWPRDRILLLASLLVTSKTGAADRTVSIEGFLDQNLDYVGNSYSFTPRFGIEAEPIRDRLVGRVGTYVEPSRYDYALARQHFTFGADVNVLPWNVFGLVQEQNWRISFFVDLAPRYQNAGLGIGVWH
jgi:hypothetical protein